MESIDLQGNIVFIDSEDFDLIQGFKWVARNYPQYSGTYAIATRRKAFHMMHRLIAGAGEFETVLHTNGNLLDNRKNNLTSNGHKVAGQTGSSKYRGVSIVMIRDELRWQATVYDARIKQIYNVGRFSFEHEAAEAYDKRALEMFGKFARLNFEGGDAR